MLYIYAVQYWPIGEGAESNEKYLKLEMNFKFVCILTYQLHLNKECISTYVP